MTKLSVDISERSRAVAHAPGARVVTFEIPVINFQAASWSPHPPFERLSPRLVLRRAAERYLSIDQIRDFP